MLELMLAGGKDPRGTFFPDSGPGTKWLKKGDENLGWFGEVNSSELFTAEQVMGAANFWAGVNASVTYLTGSIWLKFFHKGKVVYIAKRPLKSSVSWIDIYNAGLLYGTRDNGKNPLGVPIYQYIQMVKKEGSRTWGLKPRLPTGMLTDPYPVSPDNAQKAGGEWAQLLGRVVNASNGIIAEKWDNVGNIGFNSTASYQSWTQETLSGNNNLGLIRGSSTSDIEVVGAPTKASVTGQWRPVLELLDPNELNDPVGISFASVGQVVPWINDYRPPVDSAKAVIKANSALWPNPLPLVTYSIPTDHLRTPKNVVGTFDSPELRAFTITGSYVL